MKNIQTPMKFIAALVVALSIGTGCIIANETGGGGESEENSFQGRTTGSWSCQQVTDCAECTGNGCEPDCYTKGSREAQRDVDRAVGCIQNLSEEVCGGVTEGCRCDKCGRVLNKCARQECPNNQGTSALSKYQDSYCGKGCQGLPGLPMNCVETRECVDCCPGKCKDFCTQECKNGATESARRKFNALRDCLKSNGCLDSGAAEDCAEQNCPVKLETCRSDSL